MVELILFFLVGPVAVGISLLLDSRKDKAMKQRAVDSLQPTGYLEENYYTRNEPYQRYEGGEYER